MKHQPAPSRGGVDGFRERGESDAGFADPCSHVFAKLYRSKALITTADILNDRVVPFYNEHNIEIEDLLTDNGREFTGVNRTTPLRSSWP